MGAQVRIVGTSHISSHSVDDIKRAFDEFSPDVIAVELDARRLHSLQDQKTGVSQKLPLSAILQVGVTGYVFLLIGRYVQQKLGGIVKIQPGADMLSAVELARKHEKRLVLADRDIVLTLRRLSKAFTWREKLRVAADVILSPFQKKKMKIDIRKVPSGDLLKELMGFMKARYPGLYRVLVEERNMVMAANVDRIIRLHPQAKVLLVVGAGHVEDLRARMATSEIFSLA